MGGKTKIFDAKQLESLYLESRGFQNKANSGMQIIQNELARLNDPSQYGGLPSEERIAAKSAIAEVGNAVEVLKYILETTSRFIDNKLAGAAHFMNDEHGLARAVGHGKGKGNTVDIRLKK